MIAKLMVIIAFIVLADIARSQTDTTPAFTMWSEIDQRENGEPVPSTRIYRIYKRESGTDVGPVIVPYEMLLDNIVDTKQILYMPYETCWDLYVTAAIPEENLESLASNVVTHCTGLYNDAPIGDIDWAQPMAPTILEITP